MFLIKGIRNIVKSFMSQDSSKKTEYDKNNYPMLYDIILHKKHAVSGLTSNPILDAFDSDYCKILDSLAANDGFVKDRVDKALAELELAGEINYNDHYRTAFDAYNEAVIYYEIQKRGFKVSNIPETKTPTPDFCVEFSFKDGEQNCITDTAYVEVKSLSFADGNLEYQRVQDAALDANIHSESQRNRGRQICSSEYCVSPLGSKDTGWTSEIEIINRKIEQNIKQAQYGYGNGKDTLLLVDLSQYIFPFSMEDCLPVFPDLKRKCSMSGRLWMTAFGRLEERIFAGCEFEGKGNFDHDLQQQGILLSYPFIKGIIFASGTSPNDKRFLGLYRYEENEDVNAIVLMYQLCDYVNDDQNTKGFHYFSTL